MLRRSPELRRISILERSYFSSFQVPLFFCACNLLGGPFGAFDSWRREIFRMGRVQAHVKASSIGDLLVDSWRGSQTPRHFFERPRKLRRPKCGTSQAFFSAIDGG